MAPRPAASWVCPGPVSTAEGLLVMLMRQSQVSWTRPCEYMQKFHRAHRVGSLVAQMIRYISRIYILYNILQAGARVPLVTVLLP